MNHTVIQGNSNCLSQIATGSVQLIVTSPPYPMIEMWDAMFSEQDPEVGIALENKQGDKAFAAMHRILNATWDECDRVLASNGFICINIGDATRTIDGDFKLYSNHTAIINYFLSKGYSVLPDIHWRKQTNAPNRFMGSGMYPAGAYVTYEHEYILIFRKGGKRQFSGKLRDIRQESAYFWEERNIWFSDLWEIKGASQIMPKTISARDRSAAFPLEIPYRLVNMYSVKDDLVLDPFCGLGTTNVACALSERNSIGVDISQQFVELARERLDIDLVEANNIIDQRIEKHIAFIRDLPEIKKEKCYDNENHGFLVKTRQEKAIHIKHLKSKELTSSGAIIEYE